MSGQTISPSHLVTVATLWTFIRAIDAQKPGLVTTIKGFLKASFTLIGFSQSHKEEIDRRECVSSRTTLEIFFSSGFSTCRYTVVQWYRQHDYEDNDGEHEVTQYSLDFDTAVPEKLMTPKVKTDTGKTKGKLFLFAPEQFEDYEKYGKKSFELWQHGLQVVGKDGKPYPLVKIVDHGSFFIHCISELQGTIERATLHYPTEDTYTEDPRYL